MSDIERQLAYKAIHQASLKSDSLFRFCYLKKELNIKSIKDIFASHFLGNFSIKLHIAKTNEISGKGKREVLDYLENTKLKRKELLKIMTAFFEQFETALKTHSNPYISSDFKAVRLSNCFDRPKRKVITKDVLTNTRHINRELQEDTTNKTWSWYMLDSFYGNNDELALLQLIKEHIEQLQEQYEKVYLLRNEEVYKIYDFKEGKGFMPDFLLFLQDKTGEKIYYQVFIEVKGEQFLGEDGTFEGGKEGWKANFLAEITERYGNNKAIITLESKKCKLIGLPFFNTRDKQPFKII